MGGSRAERGKGGGCRTVPTRPSSPSSSSRCHLKARDFYERWGIYFCSTDAECPPFLLFHVLPSLPLPTFLFSPSLPSSSPPPYLPFLPLSKLLPLLLPPFSFPPAPPAFPLPPFSPFDTSFFLRSPSTSSFFGPPSHPTLLFFLSFALFFSLCPSFLPSLPSRILTPFLFSLCPFLFSLVPCS